DYKALNNSASQMSLKLEQHESGDETAYLLIAMKVSVVEPSHVTVAVASINTGGLASTKTPQVVNSTVAK
ncbi:hypothetical protein JOB18_015658, partial [Solea senegalensis]